MGKQRTVTQRRRSGWQQWTAAKAQDVLGNWRVSGLPLATFAREQGLNDTRLRWWKTRLGDWDGDESPARVPAFIPAVTREVVESASTSTRVTVRLPGGVVVEVADPVSVPSEWLMAVVSGLSRAG